MKSNHAVLYTCITIGALLGGCAPQKTDKEVLAELSKTTNIEFPEGTHVINHYRKQALDSILWAKMTIPDAEASTFLSQDILRNAVWRNDSNFVKLSKGWWDWEKYPQYQYTEIRLPDGSIIHILIAMQAEKLVVFLEWFTT